MRGIRQTLRPAGARALGALVVAVLLSSVTAGASSAGPTQQDLDAAKARLVALNRSLDQLIESYDAAKVALGDLQGHLSDTRQAADQAQAAAQHARDVLAERARLAYEGMASGIDVVLGTTSLNDFNDSLQFLDSVAKEDVAAATQAEVTRRAAELATARLQAALQEQQGLMDTLSTKQRQIESSIADQQALVADLQHQLTQQELQKVLKQPDPGGGGPPPPTPTPSPTPPPPPPPPSGGADAAVKAAYSALGVPYKWGGDNPNDGFDCSGLTMWSWAQGGVSLPHSSAEQYQVVPHVSKSDLQPGDLLFFYQPISHVAMYVGNNQMIHATHPGSVVSLDTIDSYWWAVFSGAGRPG